MPETKYCGTNELNPIELEELFSEDDRHREYHGIYHRTDKIMYFGGKPYVELKRNHHPKSD